MDWKLEGPSPHSPDCKVVGWHNEMPFLSEPFINCNNDFSAAANDYAIRPKSLRVLINIHADVLYRIVPKITAALLLEIISST